MNDLKLGIGIADDIDQLLNKLRGYKSHYKYASKMVRTRSVCPVDYMRYAEFDTILRDLKLKPGSSVLDVSSPQWFSLCLASKYPTVNFSYINIIDRELDPYAEVADILGIDNLKYYKNDVRDMQFSDNEFDEVISISVIEHVFPEKGGDLKAISEIYRVLKSDGSFLLTIPYKSSSNIVYKDGEVYERSQERRNFYAREYDESMLNTLIEESEFCLADSWFICEDSGFFPLDYYEWGPGKNVVPAKYLIKSKRLLERITRRSIDRSLAKRYLKISREIAGRTVNISIKLSKV